MTSARRTRAELLGASGLLGLLLLLAFASLAPSSARAGDICVGHPSDPSVVCVRSNDMIVDACDRENDTHRVYARVITQASSPNFQSPYYDDNGSNPGCGNFTFSSRVLSVAVCVQTEGCSAFKQTAPAAPAPSVPPPAATPSGPATLGDPVIYAAGDISCNLTQRQAPLAAAGAACQSQATYRKIRELEAQRGNPGLPRAVLALGDLQYETGLLPDFRTFYEADWGPLKPVTFPALGNHEYGTPRKAKTKAKAEGYWKYFAPDGRLFGARGGNGWYARTVGAWRIYAINSNCTDRRGRKAPVSCAQGSAQYNWLRRDMRKNPQTCSLMFMHHPYWDSSKDDFNTPKLRPLIREFWARGGDVVLAGHAHDYERFARSNADQEPVSPKARGFRMFIVGTGGRNLLPLEPRINKREDNRRKLDNTDFGVLQLRLGNGNYGWRFASAVNTGGDVLDDSGTGRCNPPLR